MSRERQIHKYKFGKLLLDGSLLEKDLVVLVDSLAEHEQAI